MFDDHQLIQSTWSSATGIRAPEAEDLHALEEFTEAVARAALGLPRFVLVDTDREAAITISDAMTSMPLDVIDDLWAEHAVRQRPTDPEVVHRYVFHVGLLVRPDRTDLLPLQAPAPETLEWLWSRGVDPRLPPVAPEHPRRGGDALGTFIDSVLVRARHAFLAQDRRLEDWELLESLDGDIVPVDGLWEEAGLTPVATAQQDTFRTVVAWYVAPRVAGGGLTLGPTVRG